jgi:hypothetical protein
MRGLNVSIHREEPIARSSSTPFLRGVKSPNGRRASREPMPW